MVNKHNDFKLITIHSRTAIFFVVGFFGFLICTLIVLRFFLLYGIERIENREIERANQQANAIIHRIIETQKRHEYDWAYWDDTYDFMTVGDHGYIRKNLGGDVFDVLNLDMMIFLNTHNNIEHLSGRFSQIQNERLAKSVLNDPAIRRFLMRFKGRPVTDKQPLSGIVLARGDMYIISMLPIKDSQGIKPSVGWLIFARNLKSRFPDSYAPILSGETSIREFSINETASDVVYGITKTPNSMYYRSPIVDMSDKTIGILTTAQRRAYYLQGNRALVRLTTLIVIIGCIISVAMLLLYRYKIGNKIIRFEKGLHDILADHIQLDQPGGDEFDRIINWVTKLAESSNQRQDKLNDIIQRFDVLYKSKTLGMLLLVDATVVDVNQALLTMLGYGRNEVIGENVKKLCATIEGESCGAEMLMTNLEQGITSFDAVMHSADGNQFDCFIEAIMIEQDANVAVIMSVRDVSHQRQQAHLIEELTTKDITTGFYNRPMIRQQVEAAITLDEQGFSLLYIGIERVKEIADVYGEHTYGGLIKHIANVIRSRFPDFAIGRVSEYEFVVFAEGEQSSESLGNSAKSLRREFRPMIEIDDIEIKVDVNAIILSSDLALPSFDAYVQTAAYSVTENKSHHTKVVSSVDKSLAKRAQLLINISRDFVAAIRNREFVPYFQPIVDAETEAIVGYEALARWDHPTFGIISPLVFVPLAETRKLIIELGEQIIESACEFLQTVNQERALRTLMPLCVHVNIASPHFHYHGLLDFLMSMLERYQIHPEQLVLELTESILLEAEEETMEQMNRIKSQGFSLALDDFGTGYSSFSTLSSFPIDTVKLDRSYVSQLDDNERARVLVQGILGISKQLGLITVAEGVETASQYAMLKTWHVSEIQGFYFSRPLEPAIAKELAIENG